MVALFDRKIINLAAAQGIIDDCYSLGEYFKAFEHICGFKGVVDALPGMDLQVLFRGQLVDYCRICPLVLCTVQDDPFLVLDEGHGLLKRCQIELADRMIVLCGKGSGSDGPDTFGDENDIIIDCQINILERLFGTSDDLV